MNSEQRSKGAGHEADVRISVIKTLFFVRTQSLEIHHLRDLE